MTVEAITIDRYREALPSTGIEPFHHPAALSTLATHSDAELRLLGAFRGERPVGLWPVFERDRRVGRTVTSPPPGFGVPRLGPVIMPASPKRRKREKLYREFVEEALEELDAEERGTLFRTITPAPFADPRPFGWSALDVETAFTYHVPAAESSLDELRSGFSKSLRREIRDAEAIDVSVETEPVATAAPRVHEETAARYREQDRAYPLSAAYVADLTSALAAEDRCRVYVARDADGAFLSGITVLYSDEAAYFWQGGTRTVHEGVGVNGLLHWAILSDLVDAPPVPTVERYDLMGANTERLCRYKSKFGGELVPYYVAESAGVGMDLAKRTYRALRG